MRGVSTKRLSAAALLAAAIFAVTRFLPIPVPGTAGGYLNLGDSVIYATAMLVGGPLAAASSAVGSALADLTYGAAAYIPATFVIKGLMALVAAAIMKRGGARAYILAAVAGGAIMVLGYAAYEAVIFDVPYAIAAAPFNCVQWGGNAVISAALYAGLKRLKPVAGL
ncbi:MAG: ECF transporter S component [Oscillospiraceae bacterium]|nr:ECF transporter S component [Oscillospiraceae bacterium]